MRTFFLWFYCLPIADAVCLISLATVLFIFLKNKFRSSRYWHAAVSFLLVCWIIVILFATLGYRTKDENPANPILMPLRSYFAVLNGGAEELYRSNFMNITLFYPAGLLGHSLLPGRWKQIWKTVLVTCFFALASICIELIQYQFHLGLAETDDVIHNALGALLGALACGISIAHHQP